MAIPFFPFPLNSLTQAKFTGAVALFCRSAILRADYHWMERSYGTFQRALQLPYALDPEQVQARPDPGRHSAP